MNVLLSAFACRPNFGSEPGVGWNFAIELAKRHQVYVITRSENREHIMQYQGNNNINNKNITFLYYDISKYIGFRSPNSFLIYIYYFLWQIGIFFKAKKWIVAYKIDLIHHITYGVFRIPSFLAFLNRPFIFGPLGGGEHYPFYLKKSFKKRHILIELLRDFVNKLSFYNPLLRLTYKNSILIACKNHETLKQIPSKYHKQCIVNTEIGLHTLPKSLEKQQERKIEGLKLLYVGRLVYWKGLHLVLEAFSILHKYSNHRLTVIGSGRDKKWLENKAIELNINHKISWVDKVPQDQLFNMYQNYDLMVFPSLREAGGNVVIEAIAHKLPVMCLQLGGPGEHIIEECGIVISTENKNEQKIIKEISKAIENMDGDRETLNQFSAKAQLHAKHFMLENIVNQIYNHPILQVQMKNTFKLV